MLHLPFPQHVVIVFWWQQATAISQMPARTIPMMVRDLMLVDDDGSLRGRNDLAFLITKRINQRDEGTCKGV